MLTVVGGMIGTHGYMSPERANPAVADADTRTAVYSLGQFFAGGNSLRVTLGPRTLRTKALGRQELLGSLKPTEGSRPTPAQHQGDLRSGHLDFRRKTANRANRAVTNWQTCCAAIWIGSPPRRWKRPRTPLSIPGGSRCRDRPIPCPRTHRRQTSWPRLPYSQVRPAPHSRRTGSLCLRGTGGCCRRASGRAIAPGRTRARPRRSHHPIHGGDV